MVCRSRNGGRASGAGWVWSELTDSGGTWHTLESSVEWTRSARCAGVARRQAPCLIGSLRKTRRNAADLDRARPPASARNQHVERMGRSRNACGVPGNGSIRRCGEVRQHLPRPCNLPQILSRPRAL